MANLKEWTRQLVVAAALAALYMPFSAWAFPDKPIRLIVPNPPGGAVDLLGRMMADKMKGALGQPILVENRAGAGGVMAAETVAKAPPDGYTLILGGGSSFGANSAVYKKLSYDPVKDFAPISLLVRAEWGLYVNPTLPARNAAGLVALAKSRPGKINYASYGQGSSNHLMTENLMALSGIDLVHIPYKGSVAAQLGVITNDAQVLIDGIGSGSAHVQSGKLRMIGVGGVHRSALVPEIPTISESGVPGFEATSNFSLYAPAGTSNEVIKILHQAVVNTLKQAEVRQWLTSQAYDIVGSTPAELANELIREISRWQALVRERRLKFD